MTRTTRIVRPFALLWLSAIVSAQVRDAPARPVTGTSVIAGTVVAGATGTAPARRARVTLRSTDGLVEARTATTDDEGRFEFAGLPAGRFTLDVRRPGYLDGSYGASKPGRAGSPVSIDDGARATGLTIRIVRGAAVTGTVRDSRGRPVPGIAVSALRFTYSYLGERSVNPWGGATTDDRGVYRLWGLPAGDYVVAASPSVVQTSGAPGPGFHRQTADEIDRLLSVPRGVNTGLATEPADRRTPESTSNYSPVFHPGTADFQSAATFSLADEEERGGVDIAISLVPTSRISGLVRLADGRAPTPVALTLSSASESASVLSNAPFMRAVNARTDSEGRFVFEDVPPGRFRVMAKLESKPPASPRPAGGVGPTLPSSNSFLWASAMVDMQGTPVGVQLDLQPSQTITGRLVFDGASAPPRDVTGRSIRLNPPGRGSDIGTGPNGNVNSDHTFTLNGVTPDSYRIIELSQRPWDGPWQLKSAVAGGRDAFDAPLVVAPGENLELVLTYTDRPSEITGTFQDASGRPAPDYFIVIFPADRRLWTSFRRLRSTRPASDGQYSMMGLPTGDYLVAALTDFRTEDMYAPSFLSELSTLAATVSVTEGQVTRQDLKIGK